MAYTTRFVGLDISKSSLDVCLLPDEERASFPNTVEGCANLVTFLASLAATERVILEPTGGYERLAVAALQAAGLPVAKVNARQVRQFARACGQLSKTDSIDAFVLADYGRRMHTRILPERSAQSVLLAQLVLRYRQLSHMIVQEKNRREKLTGGEADTLSRDWIEQTLHFLCGQRQTVVDEMAACLKADADLAAKAEVLMSLKGIGMRTACFLLADLPELGLIEKAQIAKLV
ncbi:transposase, partial [Shinella pollutisoli]